MIYFVQAADGSSAVKIGYTNNLEVRLKQLETHYGRPMAVLHTLPGGRTEEAKLHRRFAHLRVGRTEQFRPEPDLMQFIGRPLFVNQGDVPLIEAAGIRSRFINVVLSPEDHHQLRVEAAIRNQSMTSLVRDITREFLARAQKGGKK